MGVRVCVKCVVGSVVYEYIEIVQMMMVMLMTMIALRLAGDAA